MQQFVSCTLKALNMIYKHLLLFFITAIMLQQTMAQNNYHNNWKKVTAAEEKGLTKTALQEVTNIYKLAQKDNMEAQQIKACMYLIRYRNIVEENSSENNIFFVDTLIRDASVPAKNILQSMQAEMYWQYLQNNRYKFYNRTKINEENSKDFSTWSLDKLHQTITALYKASLQNESILQSTGLATFEPIIIKGENTRKLRPTLFDFLAHRSLAYFVTDEHDLTRPAYQFTLQDDKIFAPANDFIKAIFITKDTASLQYNALLLLQQIMQFHLADEKPDALLDADLIRLNFVNEYGTQANKEKLYEAALLSIEEKFSTHPAAAEAMYLRANLYYNNGIKKEEQELKNPINQYEIKRAKELCDIAVARFPSTEGSIHCANLLQQILQPLLEISTEKVNLPHKPFRSLLQYKNVPVIYCRIIKINNDEIKNPTQNDANKMWARITALKPLKSWQVDMPDPKDFQQHAVEIKVDALPNGTYYLLVSTNKAFSLKKNIICKQVVYVSNIASISNKNDYYVLHRETGMPIPAAKIQFWQNSYNYNTNSYEQKKAGLYTTDNNGYSKISQSNDNSSVIAEITTANDQLFLQENSYSNYYYNDFIQQDIIIKPTSFLFTDRSIYRPGQTIFFKGIIIQTDKEANKNKVVPNFTSMVQLRDANGQKVNEIKVITNQYGSYHGSFKLPEGALNGSFSLLDTATNGSQYFNVEEYKRPKFLVEVQKPAGTYRINDSISVTGNAKGYAGNNIDGALVKYRVVRKVQYPIWWGWGGFRKGGRLPYGNNEEVEISNGTATTNASGSFTIPFKALPNESISKKDQPTFYYQVSADVTDINGETRSAETSVAVAYQALQMSIVIADKIKLDTLKNLLVKTTNLNNIEEYTSATISIEKLVSPNKIFRERYWEEPDQFVMSNKEYSSYFPLDVYKNENEVQQYPVAEKIIEKTDSSNTAINIEQASFTAGWYKIIATAKDKFGEVVRAEKYIQVIGNIKQTDEPIVVTIDKNKAEPGDKIQYSIQTGFDKIWLIHAFSRMNEQPVISYKNIAAAKAVFFIETATAADRGGMAINYLFVKNNRVYNGNQSISIPWSNKELNISYSTFRDKLLPGASEKWTAKITGNKGEKLASEILVSMYDASLDQFKQHNWSRLDIWPLLFNNINWVEKGFEQVQSVEYNGNEYNYSNNIEKSYDRLLEVYKADRVNVRGVRGKVQRLSSAAPMEDKGAMAAEVNMVKFAPPAMERIEEIKEDQVIQSTPKNQIIEPNKVRINFNETAFFFPDVQTDEEGNTTFSFTMPEALTQWKLQTFAHTIDAASGYLEKTLVTQKPLMVQPNAPRFMTEGDNMEFSAKIINLSDSEITGTTMLELLDAATNNPVDGWLKNVFPNQYFTVAAGQSVAVKFPMEIPFNFNSALTYRIKAAATNGSFSDGEEAAIPILTNRMLVTETLPLNVRNTNKKTFKFEKLLNSGNSETIVNHALTVEFTSNPVWYAVQALPYLMEYPYDCAEQTFNRYYANTLASFVANANPKIKAVFEKWKTTDTAALLSNLQKNEELKAALLQETPWVLDAQNEAQQKRNIALLFDMVKLGAAQEKAFAKLVEMQTLNGGFVWFKGGPDDRYITQYIITGVGHLRKLKAINTKDYEAMKPMVDKALTYLDKKIKDDYDNLLKQKIKLSNNNVDYTAIQYLYMRSFFTEVDVAGESKNAVNYFTEQTKKYWLTQNKYMQGMIALLLHRLGNTSSAKAIIKSLKENAINNQELGMYWKDWANGGGYYWHQAPIESQAIMIEAFTDIEGNTNTINDLKTWLLKQKQTQNWKTTKATAEACYALLLSNEKAEDVTSLLLNAEKNVLIKLGAVTINTNNTANTQGTNSGVEKTAAGTGYFKKRFEAKDIQANMGNVEVTIQSTDNKKVALGSLGTSFGAIYWQYFEDLDKITPSATPLKLNKKLFIETNADKGPVLKAVEEGTILQVGNKVIVRIEVMVDRNMEYVHMKDRRAACMEPVNVLSGYKYQGGLGYYESTKDASTNFFFSWLNKGTYVFEYPLFVTHAGNFSNGITSIQSMYAPEFTSHSEGSRVKVEEVPKPAPIP